MPYVFTDEQLLAQIRNGKTLGQLSALVGREPSWLEEFAEGAGYVFGSNGVPRRSAIPLIEEHELRADDSPAGAERSQEPWRPHECDDYHDGACSTCCAASMAPCPHAEASPPPDPESRDHLHGSGAIPAAAGGGELARYSAAELIYRGRQSTVQRTRTMAERAATVIAELRRTLVADAQVEATRALAAQRRAESAAIEARERRVRADNAAKAIGRPPSEADEIRRWAIAEGMQIASRGRIPILVVD